MSTLSTLKLTATTKPTQVTAVQQRRNKLAKRVWEQIELAKALQAGTQFVATKFRTVTDSTGVRKQVEMNKRVKAWWFTADNGKLALCVRYGSKVLELARVSSLLKWALKRTWSMCWSVVKTAVLNGELDAAIDNAANKLRDGFSK
jgi:hypothetical protein